MSIDTISQQFDQSLPIGARRLIVRAAEFARLVVAPQAADWQRRGVYPTDTLRAACAAGLADVELPKQYGGPGLSFSAKLRMVEELARHDFGFAFSLVNHHNALVRIATASAPLRDRLLEPMLAGTVIGGSAYTEPGHGSDLAQLETTAQRTQDGWRLDGEKSWTTNAAVANVLLTLAQSQPGSGSRGAMLVAVEADCAGFERLSAYHVPGGAGIGAAGFRLRGYMAPDDALLASPGEAFRQALAGINGARCYVAAMCCGMLEEAIQIATRHALTRQTFGRALVEHQGLRWSLVEAQTELTALRLLTYRAARMLDDGDDAEAACAMAKKYAGDRLLQQLAACVQVLGANGLLDQYPLMRHLSAAKIACFTDGTTEMMNERLGRLMVRSCRDA